MPPSFGGNIVPHDNHIPAMIFRQLIDHDSYTYTYLLAAEKSGEALLIDPVKSKVERDLAVIAALGVDLKYVLDTHIHADHITA
ncbi:MAG: hypothetical protein IID15_05235, partial [Candidatus Marinimicrobia bacterium]|nr:hypothetical protein [Candidatus Neomarinimicrobiota bacterium]